MVEVADKPVTIEQAVEWLRWYLEPADLATLAATDEDDLIEQHFELGFIDPQCVLALGQPGFGRRNWHPTSR